VAQFAFKVIVGSIINASKVLGVLRNLFTVIGNVIVTAFRAGVVAFNLLKVALAANPLGAILLVIGLLVTGFTLLYSKSESFRNLINGIGTSIKSGLGAAVDFVSTKFTNQYHDSSQPNILLLELFIKYRISQ
jgi:phage-related protein